MHEQERRAQSSLGEVEELHDLPVLQFVDRRPLPRATPYVDDTHEAGGVIDREEDSIDRIAAPSRAIPPFFAWLNTSVIHPRRPSRGFKFGVELVCRVSVRGPIRNHDVPALTHGCLGFLIPAPPEC